jgi:O-antigen/teichoic acid export membrane protein
MISISTKKTSMKVIKNYSYQILSTVYVGVISLILNVFIARYLGPEQFGFFNLVIITSSFFFIFFDSGMRNFIIKENLLITENYNNNIRNKDLLSIGLGNGLIILIITISFLYFFKSKTEYVLGVICFFLVSQQQLISSFLKGKKEFLIDSFWHMSIRTLSFLMILFFFFFKDLNINGIFIFWSISIIILIYLLKKKIKLDYSLNFNAKIYKYTFFFILIDIVVFINFKSDLYLLKLLNYDNNIIGLYSVSFKFVEMVAMVISPLCIVLLPSLRENLNQVNIYKNNFFKFLKIFIFLSFLFFIFFFVFEQKLINYFYGNLYYDSYKYLKLSKYLIFFLPLTGFLTYTLISRDLKKEFFIILLFALIIKLTFSLKFHKMFNEFSIIYGSIISEMFIFITSFLIIYIKINNEKKKISY